MGTDGRSIGYKAIPVEDGPRATFFRAKVERSIGESVDPFAERGIGKFLIPTDDPVFLRIIGPCLLDHFGDEHCIPSISPQKAKPTIRASARPFSRRA